MGYGCGVAAYTISISELSWLNEKSQMVNKALYSTCGYGSRLPHSQQTSTIYRYSVLIQSKFVRHFRSLSISLLLFFWWMWILMRSMARDFLAVRGANFPVESENSKARYTITDARSRLSSQSVQACLCLKSWHHLLGLDPDVVQLDHEQLQWSADVLFDR